MKIFAIKMQKRLVLYRRGKARYLRMEKKTKDKITMKRIKKAWKGTRSTKYIRVYILKTRMCSPTAKPYTLPAPAQTQSCNYV